MVNFILRKSPIGSTNHQWGMKKNAVRSFILLKKANKYVGFSLNKK